MICPQCQTQNRSDAQVCVSCKTVLVATTSPFGDYLPAWAQTGLSAAAPVARPPSSQPAASFSFSIDDLLRATDTGPLTTPAPPSASAPVSVNLTAAPMTFGTPVASFPTSTSSLPMPTFEQPPLWATPPASKTWSERPADHRQGTSVIEYERRNGPFEAPPTLPGGPAYGVDRGFYFYHDEMGELVLLELANYGPRALGAIIDSFIAGFLGFLLFWVVGSAAYNPRNPDFELVVTAQVLSGQIAAFLYNALLVGLRSQTVGHQIMKIKVIRSGGRTVGFSSALVRSLYGLVPGIWAAIASNFGFVGVLLITPVYLVVIIGLLLPLFNDSHQGLHDRLADTYVVNTRTY